MKEIETDNNVGGKTPEEIKKGILCDGPCNECAYRINIMSYGGCSRAVVDDTIALIEQLEERNNRLEYTLMGVMHSVDKWLKVEPYDFDKDDGTEAVTRAANAREIMLKAIEHLERERDAALADLKGLGCTYCKRLESPDESMCFDKCVDDCNWEWRGVKLDLIQHLESHSPKWTNVAEQLPQKPGKYLVYSKVGTMYTSRFDPDIHKRWPHFGKVGVTHWTQRPEEPKEN